MNIRDLGLPFRVGATSYVIEDDLALNARFLADRVQDMQLVLFDLPDGPSNLPDARTLEELCAIGRDHDLSYTVHLIDDLRLFGPDGRPSGTVERARQVVDLTRVLAPFAYVLHLDGKEFRGPEYDPDALLRWQAESLAALSMVAEFAGDATLLAVENLESYTPGFVTPVVERLPVCRCVDVGHLWLDGHDAVPYLKSALPRTRVVHIHGIGERDHGSLTHCAPEELDAVIFALLAASFDGVFTLEVFGRDDFESSMAALAESVRRLRAK